MIEPEKEIKRRIEHPSTIDHAMMGHNSSGVNRSVEKPRECDSLQVMQRVTGIHQQKVSARNTAKLRPKVSFLHACFTMGLRCGSRWDSMGFFWENVR